MKRQRSKEVRSKEEHKDHTKEKRSHDYPYDVNIVPFLKEVSKSQSIRVSGKDIALAL